MKSQDQLIQRLRAVGAVRMMAQRLREEIGQIDVREHIAEVYHPLHEDLSSGAHTFYNLPGGRGSGKSSFCALEIVDGIMKDPTQLSSALVVRKWAITLRSSVYNQIGWAIQELGVSSHWRSTLTPLQYVCDTGQVIKFTGLDDPQKLKSLKPSKGYFGYLWLEELCELTGERELRNLQQSILRGGDSFRVLRSFNPPISRSNWANELVARADPQSVTLLTNYLQIPPEWLGQVFLSEAEKLKEVNERAYQNEYLGLPVGNGSEVFENLEIREIPDEEYKSQTNLYGGIDWGFSKDPAVFLRVSYDPKREEIRILDEIYKTHLSNKELAELIKEKGYHLLEGGYMSPFGGYIQSHLMITCDSSEPKSVSDMVGLGLKARACQKFAGCVEYRVKWLQHRKIIVDPARTPNTARELQNYHYEVDKGTGEILSKLTPGDDHTIDSLAYALDTEIYVRKNSA